MEDKNFMEDLASILEIEPNSITMDFPFNRDNWNSLTIVSAIVLIDEHFGISIEGEKLRKCSTVGELWQLIEDVKNNQ